MSSFVALLHLLIFLSIAPLCLPPRLRIALLLLLRCVEALVYRLHRPHRSHRHWRQAWQRGRRRTGRGEKRSRGRSNKRQEERRKRQQREEEEEAEEERREREKDRREVAALRSAQLAHLHRTRQERLQKQAKQTQRLTLSARLSPAKKVVVALNRSAGGGGEESRLEQLLRDASLSREEGKERRDRALRELARGRGDIGRRGDVVEIRQDTVRGKKSVANTGGVFDEEWSQQMLREMMEEYQFRSTTTNNR
jgi:hypothetical protein